MRTGSVKQSKSAFSGLLGNEGVGNFLHAVLRGNEDDRGPAAHDQPELAGLRRGPEGVVQVTQLL